MAILFSDLIKNEAFEIKNRKRLRAFYERVKTDVAAGRLKLEGHTLPTTFNTWLGIVEPNKKPPAKDADVVDFSLKDDAKFAGWRKSYLSEQNPVYLSAAQKELLERVQELEAVSKTSMDLMNGTKDDVVAALSDLQAAVYMFGASYDKLQKSSDLPERSTPLERVKVGKPAAKKSSAKKSVGAKPGAKVDKKSAPKRRSPRREAQPTAN